MNQSEIHSFFKELHDYVDQYGFISQHKDAGSDGGDSAHRFGIAVYCLNDLGFTREALNMYSANIEGYEAENNSFRRHPDTTKWYSSPLNFSRDQTVMLTAGMIAMKDYPRIKKVIDGLIKRGGFHQNRFPNYVKPSESTDKLKTPDFITFSQVSTLIRGAKAYLLYPIALLTDLTLPADVLVAAFDDYLCKRKGKRTDQFVMMIPILRETQKSMTFSPGAFIARKLMKLFDWQGSVNWIFGKKEWNDPPLHKLLIPVGEKL